MPASMSSIASRQSGEETLGQMLRDAQVLDTIIREYERKLEYEVSVRNSAQSMSSAADRRAARDASRQLEFSNKRVEVLATELVKFLKRQAEIKERIFKRRLEDVLQSRTLAQMPPQGVPPVPGMEQMPTNANPLPPPIFSIMEDNSPPSSSSRSNRGAPMRKSSTTGATIPLPENGTNSGTMTLDRARNRELEELRRKVLDMDEMHKKVQVLSAKNAELEQQVRGTSMPTPPQSPPEVVKGLQKQVDSLSKRNAELERQLQRSMTLLQDQTVPGNGNESTSRGNPKVTSLIPELDFGTTLDLFEAGASKESRGAPAASRKSVTDASRVSSNGVPVVDIAFSIPSAASADEYRPPPIPGFPGPASVTSGGGQRLQQYLAVSSGGEMQNVVKQVYAMFSKPDTDDPREVEASFTDTIWKLEAKLFDVEHEIAQAMRMTVQLKSQQERLAASRAAGKGEKAARRFSEQSQDFETLLELFVHLLYVTTGEKEKLRIPNAAPKRVRDTIIVELMEEVKRGGADSSSGGPFTSGTVRRSTNFQAGPSEEVLTRIADYDQLKQREADRTADIQKMQLDRQRQEVELRKTLDQLARAREEQSAADKRAAEQSQRAETLSARLREVEVGAAPMQTRVLELESRERELVSQLKRQAAVHRETEERRNLPADTPGSTVDRQGPAAPSRTEIERLEADAARAKASAKDMRQKMAQLAKFTEAQKSDYDMMLASLRDEINEVATRNEDLQDLVEQLRAELGDVGENDGSGMPAGVRARDARLQDLQQYTKDLEAALEERDDVIVRTQEMAREYQDRLEEATAGGGDTQAAGALRNDLERTTHELRIAEQKAESLEEQIKAMRSSSSRSGSITNADAEKLRSNLASSELKNQQLADALRVADSRVKQLQSKLFESQNNGETATRGLPNAGTKQTSGQDSLSMKELEEQLTARETSMVRMDQDLVELRKQVKDATNQLQDKIGHIARLEHDLSASREESENLYKELQTKSGGPDSMVTKDVGGEASAIRNELILLQQKHETLLAEQTQHHEGLSAREVKISELTGTISQNAAEIEALRQDNELKHAMFMAAKESEQEAQSEVIQLNGLLQDLQEEMEEKIKAAESKAAQAMSQNSTISREMGASQSTLEQAIAQKDVQLMQLQQDLESMRRKTSAKDSESEARLSAIQSALNEREATIAHLNSEIESLRAVQVAASQQSLNNEKIKEWEQEYSLLQAEKTRVDVELLALQAKTKQEVDELQDELTALRKQVPAQYEDSMNDRILLTKVDTGSAPVTEARSIGGNGQPMSRLAMLRAAQASEVSSPVSPVNGDSVRAKELESQVESLTAQLKKTQEEYEMLQENSKKIVDTYEAQVQDLNLTLKKKVSLISVLKDRRASSAEGDAPPPMRKMSLRKSSIPSDSRKSTMRDAEPAQKSPAAAEEVLKLQMELNQARESLKAATAEHEETKAMVGGLEEKAKKSEADVADLNITVKKKTTLVSKLKEEIERLKSAPATSLGNVATSGETSRRVSRVDPMERLRAENASLKETLEEVRENAKQLNQQIRQYKSQSTMLNQKLRKVESVYRDESASEQTMFEKLMQQLKEEQKLSEEQEKEIAELKEQIADQQVAAPRAIDDGEYMARLERLERRTRDLEEERAKLARQLEESETANAAVSQELKDAARVRDQFLEDQGRMRAIEESLGPLPAEQNTLMNIIEESSMDDAKRETLRGTLDTMFGEREVLTTLLAQQESIVEQYGHELLQAQTKMASMGEEADKHERHPGPEASSDLQLELQGLQTRVAGQADYEYLRTRLAEIEPYLGELELLRRRDAEHADYEYLRARLANLEGLGGEVQGLRTWAAVTCDYEYLRARLLDVETLLAQRAIEDSAYQNAVQEHSAVSMVPASVTQQAGTEGEGVVEKPRSTSPVNDELQEGEPAEPLPEEMKNLLALLEEQNQEGRFSTTANFLRHSIQHRQSSILAPEVAQSRELQDSSSAPLDKVAEDQVTEDQVDARMVENMQAEISRMRAKLEATADYEELRNRVAELEELVENLEGMLAGARAVQVPATEANDREAEFLELQYRLQDLELLVEEKDAQLAATAALNSLPREQDAGNVSSEEIEALRERNSELQAIVEDQGALLQDARKAQEQLQSADPAELAALRDEVVRLQNLESAQSREFVAANDGNDVQELQSEIERLRNAIAGAESNPSDSERLASLERELESLRCTLAGQADYEYMRSKLLNAEVLEEEVSTLRTIVAAQADYEYIRRIAMDAQSSMHELQALRTLAASQADYEYLRSTLSAQHGVFGEVESLRSLLAGQADYEYLRAQLASISLEYGDTRSAVLPELASAGTVAQMVGNPVGIPEDVLGELERLRVLEAAQSDYELKHRRVLELEERLCREEQDSADRNVISEAVEREVPSEVSAEMERLRDQVAELQSSQTQDPEVAELRAKLRELEAVRAEAEEARSRMKELEAMQAEATEVSSRDVEHVSSEEKAELERLRGEMAALEGLQAQAAEVENLRAKLNELEAVRAESEDARARLQELDKLRAEAADSSAQIEELNALREEASEVRARLEALEQEKAENAGKGDEAEAKVTDLQAQVEQAMSSLVEIKAKYSETQMELDDMQAERDQLKDIMETKEEGFAKLQEQFMGDLELIQKQYTRAQHTNEELREKIEDLELRLEEATAEAKAHAEAAAAIASSAASVADGAATPRGAGESGGEGDALKAENAALQEKVAEMQQELDDLLAKNMDLVMKMSQ